MLRFHVVMLVMLVGAVAVVASVATDSPACSPRELPHKPPPCAALGLGLFEGGTVPVNINKVEISRDGVCPALGPANEPQPKTLKVVVSGPRGVVASHLERSEGRRWLVFDEPLSEGTLYNAESSCRCDNDPEEKVSVASHAIQATRAVVWPVTAGELTLESPVTFSGHNDVQYTSCGGRLDRRRARVFVAFTPDPALVPLMGLATVSVGDGDRMSRLHSGNPNGEFFGTVNAICESEYAKRNDLLQGEHLLRAAVYIPGHGTLTTSAVPVDLRCPIRASTFLVFAAALAAAVGAFAFLRWRRRGRTSPRATQSSPTAR